MHLKVELPILVTFLFIDEILWNLTWRVEQDFFLLRTWNVAVLSGLV